MRRILPHLLAGLLGVGAALIAACGSGTSAGIPAANASDLKSQIEDVRQAVDDHRCSDVLGQLRQVDEGIDGLPPSTDDELERSLRDGADALRSVAVEECGATQATQTQTTTTETTPTTTETTPTTTETTPTTTTETTTTPTETTPTTTTPTPTTTTPPAPVPPPPPGTPGGGVEPEIP